MNEVCNTTLFEGQAKTPIEIFAQVNIAPKLSTSTPLDVQHTSWTTNYRVEKPFKNGKADPGWESTWAHHPTTLDLSVSF